MPVERAAFVAGHSPGRIFRARRGRRPWACRHGAAAAPRGQAMQRAVPVGAGAMASLIGPKTDVALAEAPRRARREAAASASSPTTTTPAMSSSPETRRRWTGRSSKAKTLGARADPAERVGALPLPADGSPPPRRWPRRWRRSTIVAAARRRSPTSPRGRPLDPEAIRRLLVEQVTGRVRWRESIEWLAGEGGVTRFAELGAGKVLTGMAKRIAPDAEARRR